MAATTDQKARMFDLITGVMELVRDGKRDAENVLRVLQIIKEERKFAELLVAQRESVSSLSTPTVKVWSVWAAMSVGGVTKDELLSRLEKGRFHVSDWARHIIGKSAFVTSAAPIHVAFIRVQVHYLGFKKMPTTCELFDRHRLAGLGLELCEPEDALYIRLADADQPRGTWYWIAMEPITDSDGSPRVFSVGRGGGGGRLLDADCAGPDDRWRLGVEVVFRLRQ